MLSSMETKTAEKLSAVLFLIIDIIERYSLFAELAEERCDLPSMVACMIDDSEQHLFTGR